MWLRACATQCNNNNNTESVILYSYTLKSKQLTTHPGLAVRNFMVVILHVTSIFSFKLGNYNTK